MAILSNLLVTADMMLFFLAICGLGALVLRAFKAEPEDGGEHLIFSFAAGAVLFSLVLLTAGKAGLFGRTQLLLLSAVVLAAAIPGIGKVMASIKELASDAKSVSGLFMLAVVVLFAPRLLAAFFNVFIPPIAWDSMAYHYAIPYIYKTAGKVVYIPFMTHSNWPQGMDIVFAWAMIVCNDILANGVSFVYSFMMLVSVFVLGKKIFNPASGLIAAAVLGSFLLFKLDSSNGYVDAGLTFFEVGAVYAVFMFVRSRDVKYLMAGAACAGGAASIKILGLFSGAFLPVLILFADFLPGGKRKKFYIAEAVLFGLAALAISSPWYIKSWIDTGNPVWPFAYKIFGGKNWPPELNAYLTDYYSKFGGGKSLLEFIKLPVKLIYSKGMDGFMGANIIYLYFMFPFTVYSIIKRKDRAQAFLMMYCAGFVLFWFAGTQMTRFFFPGMAIMTVMAAGETERIMRENKSRVKKFMAAAITIYLILFSYPIRNPAKHTGLNFFLGLYDRESFLKSNLDYYPLYSRVNADASVGGRIVLFREIRGYHLKKDYIWGDPVNQGLISYKTTEQTIKDMENNGVEYIIYSNNQAKEGAQSYTGLTRKIMEEIISKYSELMYCESGVCLYKLKGQKAREEVKASLSAAEELVRDAAYATFGASMYHAMKGKKFPVSGAVKEKEDPFGIKLDWAKMLKENKKGFPYTPCSYLDYGAAKAVLKVFNVSYAAGVEKEFDKYFKGVKASKYLSQNDKDKITNNEKDIRQKSIFYLAAFPLKDVRLAYYPGDNYYRGGTSPMLGAWADGVTDTVKNGTDTRHCKVQDSKGLLAVLNGTFYRLDAGSAGYGFDHKSMFPANDGMATVAIYDDGSMKMGTYSGLPEKEKIKVFAQNRFMILEQGGEGDGYTPKKFIKFTDNIIRSYLFMKGKDYMGYIWTTYMPQEVAAKLASDMGITDMMLLDIHSVINCAIAKPAEEFTYKSADDFREKSFAFVPTFRSTLLYYIAMKASELAGRPIQDDAVYCLFNDSPNDLFAVFLKDSPEVKADDPADREEVAEK